MQTRLIPALLVGMALLAAPAQAQKVPEHRGGWVNDYAEVIDPQTERELDSLITGLERRTGAEIAVVTVPDAAQHGDPKSLAVELLNQWGVGKKGKDNGLVLLLAMAERRLEVEVGYGLEGNLPDGKAVGILREVAQPLLRQGRQGEALLAVVRRYTEILAPEGLSSESGTGNGGGLTLPGPQGPARGQPAPADPAPPLAPRTDAGRLLSTPFLLGGLFIMFILLSGGRSRGLFGGIGCLALPALLALLFFSGMGPLALIFLPVLVLPMMLLGLGRRRSHHRYPYQQHPSYHRRHHGYGGGGFLPFLLGSWFGSSMNWGGGSSWGSSGGNDWGSGGGDEGGFGGFGGGSSGGAGGGVDW